MRLGVALLVPEPVAGELDGLRRALGDGALARVRPHLTLVPPVNVRVDDLPRALSVLRAAATTVGPFLLRLGPPTTFAPVTPTVHLAVGGDPAALAALHRLRDAVFVPPLERPLTYPFAPHVTLSDDVAAPRLAAALDVLTDYVVDVRFGRLHLLQEQRHGEAHRRWVPIADVPFGPRVVVGRGGLELELTASHVLDPEAAAFETGHWPDDRPSPPPVEAAPGCTPLVVVARRRDGVVGVVRGGVAPDWVDVASLLVAPAHRREGIGRHLLAAFHHHAAVEGP